MHDIPPVQDPQDASPGAVGRHEQHDYPLLHGSAARFAAPESALLKPSEKIVLRHLDFYYGRNRALADISMPIYDKRVTALVGPSGCGKSTLLRVLNRIYALYPDQHAAGEALLDGRNILEPSVNLRELRKRVGMVAQKPMPFPMSIYQNVSFGVGLYEDLVGADLDARVERALRRAGLWNEVKDRLRTSGDRLSIGQQQRLCIARAIALDPEVLLLDEPCSALDPISTAHIEELIDELHRDCCIVIVTHNLEQAARVSHFTAFMYLGKLVEFETTPQLFMHPADPHTEAYVSGRFG